jgi:hypothetical protein
MLVPSYRFEPYTTAISVFKDKKNKYKPNPYFIRSLTDNQMGSGSGVPSTQEHQNVGGIPYIQYPKSLWSFIYDYSELAIPGPPRAEISTSQHKIYGERTADGKMIFRGYETMEGGIQEWYNNEYDHFKDKENAGNLAREALASSFRDDIFGIGAQNIPAQTRIASSYGYLQILYTTAIGDEEHGGVSYPTNLRPEDLNKASICELYQFAHLKNIVDGQIGKLLMDSAGEWPNGFEKFILDFVYPEWNPRGNYPYEVLEFSTYYLPQ